MSTVSRFCKLKNFLLARVAIVRRGFLFLTVSGALFLPPVVTHAATGFLSAVGGALSGLVQGAAEAVAPIILWWFLLSNLAGKFAEIMSRLFVFLANFLIVISQYNSFLGSKIVEIGWAVTRDIANLFLVIALLVIAFATILNIQSYQAQSLMKNFLFAALFVNFSRTICGLLIDASQVVMATFVSGYSDTAAGNFVKVFQAADWMKLATKVPVATTNTGGVSVGDLLSKGVGETLGNFLADQLATLAAYVFTFFIALAACLALFSLLVVLVQRVVTLWMLIIVSPLAFVAQILPYTKSYASKWWDALIKQLLVGPIVAFIIWVTLASVASTADAFNLFKDSYQAQGNKSFAEAGATADIAGTAISSWENLAMFFVPLLLFIFGARWAVKFSGGMAQAITSKVSGVAGGQLRRGLNIFREQAIGKGAFSVTSQFKKGWRGEKGATSAVLEGTMNARLPGMRSLNEVRTARLAQQATVARDESTTLRTRAAAQRARADANVQMATRMRQAGQGQQADNFEAQANQAREQAAVLEQQAEQHQQRAAKMDQQAAYVKSGSMLAMVPGIGVGAAQVLSGGAINRARTKEAKKYFGKEFLGGALDKEREEASAASGMAEFQKMQASSQAGALRERALQLRRGGFAIDAEELERQAKGILEQGGTRANAAEGEAVDKFKSIIKQRGLASPEAMIDDLRRRVGGGENVSPAEVKAMHSLAMQKSEEIASRNAKERIAKENANTPAERNAIEAEEDRKAKAWRSAWSEGHLGTLPMGARTTERNADVMSSEAIAQMQSLGVAARDRTAPTSTAVGANEGWRLSNTSRVDATARNRLAEDVVRALNQQAEQDPATGQMHLTPAGVNNVKNILLEIHTRNPQDVEFLYDVGRRTGAHGGDFMNIVDAALQDAQNNAQYVARAEGHRQGDNRVEFNANDWGMNGTGVEARFRNGVQRGRFQEAVRENPRLVANIDVNLMRSEDMSSTIGAAFDSKEGVEQVRQALELRGLTADEIKKRMEVVVSSVMRHSDNRQLKEDINLDPRLYRDYWTK